MSEQVSNSVEQSEKGVSNVDAKQQDRSYNPVNDAPARNTSQALNEDSAKYQKGPGPV